MNLKFLFTAILSVASAFSAAICTAAEPPAPMTMKEAILLRVDGDLTVDPQGVPVDYNIKTTLPQNLSDALQRHVHSWRFGPPYPGVSPAMAHERVRITLATEKNDGKHPIRIDHVVFSRSDISRLGTSGSPQLPVSISWADGNSAQYPYAGVSEEINANLLVYARVTPEGRVDQVMVSQVALLNVTGKQDILRDFAKVFADQAISDVKNFRFHVEVDQKLLEALKVSDPDAVAVAFTVRFPIEFTIMGSTRESGAVWQQEVRTPRQSPSWLKPDADCDSSGVADIITGDEMVLQSECPRLITPVLGSEVVSFSGSSSMLSTSSGNPP